MPLPKIIQFPLGLAENLQYHYTKVNVSSAEILALNSTNKTLVAAPGAGKILMPIHAIVKLNFGTIVYATNTDLEIVHNGLTAPLMQFPAFITQAADWIAMIPLLNRLYSAATAENKSLDLNCDTGDPTGGDGNIDIYLWYIILEL